MTLIQGTTPIIMIAYQTLKEYAASHYAPGSINPLSERTVKRWLTAGELPGAEKDAAGQWRIPAESVRTVKESAEVVPLAGRHGTVAPVMAATAPDWDMLPTFLTLEQASQLLSPVTPRGIAANADYFGAVMLTIEGGHGHARLMVPLATIKRLRGLIR